MEAFLALVVVVLFVLWLVQRKSIEDAVRETRELDGRLSAWSSWGYTAQRQTDTLRVNLENVTRRLEALEASISQSTQFDSAASAPVTNIPTGSAPAPATISETLTLTETLEPAAQRSAAANELAQAPLLLDALIADEGAVVAPATSAVEPIATTVESAENEESGNAREVGEAQATPPYIPNAVSPDEVPPESAAINWKGLRRPTVDWESLIGVRLFSWIAGISLLLGAVFFLRYSAESGWLNPPVRMAMGLLTGILLLVTCELKGRHYRVTANAMDAAGIGTLFATSFAAHAVWHLLPTTVAMGLLILVTCVAVLLAIRRQSLFIALLGLVGGFSTPILLSTGENHPVGLFSYLLLLNVGLAIVGYRQRWPLLTCLSLAFTTLYQWGWVARFVVDDAGQLPIAVGVFLLFPAVWLAAEHFLGKKGATEVPVWLSQILTYMAALPLLLAIVMAWVPAFGERYLLLFAYLFVLDAALLILDYLRPKEHLGLIASGATCLVWASWVSQHYSSDCWPLITGILAGFVVLFLSRVWIGVRLGAPVSKARFTAPVLLGVVTMLVLQEPLAANPLVPFGVLLTLLVAVAAIALYARDGKIYYAAVPFLVLAEACWTAKFLDESRLTSGLVVYLLSALLCMGVPILGRWVARPVEPSGLSVFVPVLNLAVLLLLTLGPIAAHSLWMIGVLMLVLNVGFFIEAYACRRHYEVFFGVGLSWLVVGIWWHSAIGREQLVLALVIVLALVLLEVGGLLWLLRSRGQDEHRKRFEHSPLLGLVGHLFLLFVASQPKLSSEPWPLFAIAFLLDLALIAATLYLRRALFAVSGFAITLLILCVWSVAQPAHVPPLLAAEVALLAAAAVVGLSEFLVLVSRRRQLDDRPFRLGGNGILVLTLGLLFALAWLPDPPRVFALVTSQAALLYLLMRSSRESGKHEWVLAGWLGTCLLAFAWTMAHFSVVQYWQLLVIAAVPYALQTLYPVYCAARAKPGRWPFVIAIAGSLSFFVAAYTAIRQSPLQGYLGGLPLIESIVVLLLLVYVLRIIEPSPPRDVGRVALLAAVALGFATTAIPLQLENEWLTVAWALETAALAWLYQRLRHTGLIAASLALALAVTVRLGANPEVLLYHVRSATPLLNFYLYTYGVSATALFAASWLLRDATEVRFLWLQKTSWIQGALATLLLFALLNIEIADFYSEGSVIVFRFTSTLAQDLTYTLGWALFAIGMLIAGILSNGGAVRIAALVLLTVTIAKCFLHDLWRLGGLYRVGSFVGLALCLALVAIILQRFVLRPQSTKTST